MALLNTTSNKRAYTRKDDESIIAFREEGKSVDEVAKALNRTPASIQYRIQRVLTKHDSFDQIKYRSSSPSPSAQPAPAKAAKK